MKLSPKVVGRWPNSKASKSSLPSLNMTQRHSINYKPAVNNKDGSTVRFFCNGTGTVRRTFLN